MTMAVRTKTEWLRITVIHDQLFHIFSWNFILQALRHIRQIAQETSGEIQYGGGRQPAVLRTFSQRLCR